MSNPIENVRTPLYAAVGAGDYAWQAVSEVAEKLRSRADARQTEWQTKADEWQTKAEETRERLQHLPEEVPSQITELREKFTSEELRKVADAYVQVATDLYSSLAERGEETVDRLRQQPVVGENIERAESAVADARGLTEDALGTVAARTREVGERAAQLTGRGRDSEEAAASKGSAASASKTAGTSAKAETGKSSSAKSSTSSAKSSASTAKSGSSSATKSTAGKSTAKSGSTKSSSSSAKKSTASKSSTSTAKKSTGSKTQNK